MNSSDFLATGGILGHFNFNFTALIEGIALEPDIGQSAHTQQHRQVGDAVRRYVEGGDGFEIQVQQIAGGLHEAGAHSYLQQ